MSEQIEAERVLRIDERLGFAVTALLGAIGRHGVSAEMPDDCSGTEPDRVTRVLKPPADVDIVAGGAVDWIEPAELLQHVAAERHVAARDVLGDFVADQHMGRTAGRDRDGGRDQIVLGRREIRSAARGQIPGFHLGDEVGQPVGVGDAVAVGVDHDLAGCRLGPDIAGGAQSLIGLTYDAAILVILGDLEGSVARAVIDDDDLIVRIIEHRQRAQTLGHGPLGIVGADDDGNPRVAP